MKAATIPKTRIGRYRLGRSLLEVDGVARSDSVHGEAWRARQEGRKPGLGYGSSWVTELGKSLGYTDGQLLYQCTQVASAWPDEKAFRSLLKRRGKYSLTWSHLVALARVRDRKKQEQLVSACFQDRLSFRGLKVLLAS